MGTPGVTFGAELLFNAKSRERSLFLYAGPSFGLQGNVGLSGSVSGYTGYVWNLSKNVDYEGPFISASVSIPLGGIVSSSFSGFIEAGNDGQRTYGFTAGLGFGNNGGPKIGGAATSYSRPLATTTNYSNVHWGFKFGIPPYSYFINKKYEQNNNVW